MCCLISVDFHWVYIHLIHLACSSYLLSEIYYKGGTCFFIITSKGKGETRYYCTYMLLFIWELFAFYSNQGLSHVCPFKQGRSPYLPTVCPCAEQD